MVLSGTTLLDGTISDGSLYLLVAFAEMSLLVAWNNAFRVNGDYAFLTILRRSSKFINWVLIDAAGVLG